MAHRTTWLRSDLVLQVKNLSTAGNFKREIYMSLCHKPSKRQPIPPACKQNIRRLHNLPRPHANRTSADCTLRGVGCNPTKGDSPPEPSQTQRFFCLKYAARSGFARSKRGSVLSYVTERATPARPEIAHNSGKKKWRRGSESNRSKRFCRPLPSRLATTPRDMLYKITPETAFVNP